jgi:hypothetical protein
MNGPGVSLASCRLEQIDKKCEENVWIERDVLSGDPLFGRVLPEVSQGPFAPFASAAPSTIEPLKKFCFNSLAKLEKAIRRVASRAFHKRPINHCKQVFAIICGTAVAAPNLFAGIVVAHSSLGTIAPRQSLDESLRLTAAAGRKVDQSAVRKMVHPRRIEV